MLHIDLWPSRQSRNRCIRSKIPRYNLDSGQVEFGANATLTGSRWTSNNDITRCHREFESVGVSCRWSSSWSSRQWEPAPSSGAWALRTTGWAAQQNEKSSAAKDRGSWGLYVAVCSVSNSPLTHNPFA